MAPNESVQFDAGPGLTGVNIQFPGASPFAASTIPYGPPAHTVTVQVQPGGPANNRYPYTCTAIDANGNTVTSPGGGEMEVGGGG